MKRITFSRWQWFLARHRRELAFLSLLCFIVVLAGCAALTWLTDANSILGVAGDTLAGVLGLIASLTGSVLAASIASEISTVITDAQAGVNDVETMVEEYQQNPSPTLLGSIEAGTQAVITNIKQFLSDTGITNAKAQEVVTAILQLFLSQVENWATLLPALGAQAGDKLAIIIPMNKKQFKAAYNKILSTPTGDPNVDAALAKMKRL